MFCLIVLTTNKMSIYNNKDIITSEIVWIRQLFFPMLLFYHNVKFQFNIWYSHANTIWQNKGYLHKQFSISTYSSILHALLHSTGFHMQPSLQELLSSDSLHSHQYSSWFHFCFELHTLSFNANIYTVTIHE